MKETFKEDSQSSEEKNKREDTNAALSKVMPKKKRFSRRKRGSIPLEEHEGETMPTQNTELVTEEEEEEEEITMHEEEMDVYKEDSNTELKRKKKKRKLMKKAEEE